MLIDAAIIFIPEEEKPNIVAVSKEYEVLEQPLSARLNSRQSHTEWVSSNRKLSPDQELTLSLYITRVDELVIPPLFCLISTYAYSIGTHAHPEPLTPVLRVSHMCTPRFHQRHPEYSVRKLKTLYDSGKEDHHVDHLRNSDSCYCVIREEKETVDVNYYNIHDTLLWIGVRRYPSVVTYEPN